MPKKKTDDSKDKYDNAATDSFPGTPNGRYSVRDRLYFDDNRTDANIVRSPKKTGSGHPCEDKNPFRKESDQTFLFF
jgi:hypothetical protein